MKTLTTIITLLTLLSCSEQAPTNNSETIGIDSSFHQTPINQDSLKFLTAVSKLEDINFFVMGQDSVIVTKETTELIELNTTKSAFCSPFDKIDIGLVKYKTVDKARKYHVKLVDAKKGARPSANVIQLTFKDTKEASTWFNVYDNSPNKKVIQMKPKTELWLDSNHVYFVQTYHTPDRDYLDIIKKTLIDHLEK
jgi:hypothetical protein